MTRAIQWDRLELVTKVLRGMSENPDITREMFPEEAHDSIDLAIRISLMMDYSPLYHSTDRLEKGVHRAQWTRGEPLSKFIEGIFASESHTVLSYPEHLGHSDFKSELRATKLKRELGIAIRPTSDIRNHLKLDRKTMTLEVFHYTGFIKEHLRRTKELPGSASVGDALRLGSCSFPLSDKKSRRLLNSYVESGVFDPDMQHFEFGSIKNRGEEVVPFFYLSRRLGELHQELLDPRPQGWLERRFESRSGSRYMMMATMIGVLFAVFLGFLSLAVGSYQTYIAYQAWQHPISPAGG
ncbi:hypothetical protein LX36DRAFT_672807 [Colletotrichum falcatum]|nr:hypothetical protein LX36DRAFT_672807 [Colletotrichum falcatum]